MASVFLYHVVGDLTVGKPELEEFTETETLESAVRAIRESTECGIPVWKRRTHPGMVENNEMRQQRFVGILTSLDVVSFLAKSQCLDDHVKAIKTLVSDVVVPNNGLLKIVDPGTRLIDALEMMKQGVRRLLVPKSAVWKGMSKRFSIIYHGKWLKNMEGSCNNLGLNTGCPSPSSLSSSASSTSAYMCNNRFCCLSREDIIRFLLGCLGALAPLPLASISSLGAINQNYCSIDASLPASEAMQKHPGDPSAFAIMESTPEGHHRILGEISVSKLWKCDYLAAAWALANLSAGQFVMGIEDNVSSRWLNDICDTSKPRKHVSTNCGFNPSGPSFGVGRSTYRGRSAPLTCKTTSSLAAVMAQILSHRATHVWVTEGEDDDVDVLVGVVGYTDILAAVIKQPTSMVPGSRSNTELRSEMHH
ncbi:CBS domain-containing protein CBSX6 [Hibiscus syriacus]|uniref:CBS domain-containing protein CBSX6 n=2 Tax=Hibiscus syriacus TaxID=106335 RepID=A0A6A3CHX5_HIBSY|nr:CBS domain-containing protein CBSX6 [Hibiscus syriacus]